MSKQKVYVNSFEFEPRNKLILVKPGELKKEEVSASGIVMSIRKETVIDRPSFGKIIAVGESVDSYHVNDEVFWPMADGIDFEFLDGDFMLLKAESVIGKKK